MDDLHYLSATDALAGFRSKELSPVELMEAVITRAEKVEPVVNAFTYTHYERALERAGVAADRYARGETVGALEGLPVALKDEVELQGEPFAGGSLAERDHVGRQTVTIARRILDAGGIVHALTTTPEFSCAGFTHTKMWGVTRNPWSIDWTPGGSSGGSGAALAAGTATLASGSDIGGSIRIPASFCGVVGFKPPHGRVPLDAPYNLDQYCHNGPLARTVADCALFENVLAGPDPDDVTSLRPKIELPPSFEPIEGMRVALAVPLGDYPMDPEVERNTIAAGETFARAGAAVERVELPWRHATVTRAALVHFGAIFGEQIGRVADAHPDLVMPYATDFARRGREVLRTTSFADGLALEGQIYAPLGALLERYDVLICPNAGTRGLVAGDDYADHGVTVGDETLDFYLETVMTFPFNVASRCPVLAVPSGFADNGVPTGIQIVGRTYDDLTVFRAAAAYERIRPWLDTPERRPAL